jgi:collagenase-like PrtC family protease
VRSFKIEGRLKGENYVALTTKAYRLAIDEAWAVIQAEEANKVDGCVEKIEYKGPSHELRNDLRQVFSRGQDSEFQGLSAGFLEGVRHQNIVRGRNPRHRGLLIGSVKGKNKKGVLVELQNSIKRGDGVVFDQGRPEEHEEGGSVFTICDSKGNDLIDSGEISEKGQVLLTFGKNSINFKNIEVGDLVWKNKDPALDRRLKAEVSSSSMQLVPISVSIKASLGEPLSITMTSIPYNDGDPVFSVTTKSNNVIDKAQKVPINKEQLKKAIGTFGNTPYFSTSIDFSGFAEDDNLFLSIHDIKDTRRRAVEELIEKRRVFNQGNDIASTDVENISKIKHSLKKDALATSLSSSQKTPHSPLSEYIEEEEEDLPGKEEVHLSLLCRSPHQVDAALNIPEVQEIVLDFLEIHGLREYVAKVKAVGKRVVVATPRIIKPDEEKLYIFFVRLRADAILVRSSGFLQQLADLGGSGSFVEKFNSTIPEIYGDFSLNTANSLSASIFLGAGLARLTPTHDLNSEQIVDMVAGLEKIEKESSVALKSKIEVIVHQHMPIFHTEHCVFCRFLSNGNNFTDCGHPCESNDVHLRSMEDGSDHLVLADQGCRNTVFNAKAQSGASYISEFIKAGICNFRIELVDEPAHVIESLVKGYMDVLQGQPNSKDRLQRLLDDKVPNGYGRMQGASVGSLLPKKETPRNKLKKTAR